MNQASALMRIALFGCVLLLLPLQTLGAQAAAEHKLRPANARVNAEFTRIVGLRELPDGRVLVSDAGDKQLRLVDFAQNSAVQVGRAGRGPAEYASLSPLYAIGSDSTLMSDGGNGRWLILENDRIAGTVPPDNPAVRASRGAFRGIDKNGRVLTTTPPPIRNGVQTLGKGDSNAVLIVTASGDVDTVAKVQMPSLVLKSTVDGAGKITSMDVRPAPFAVGDESLLFPDGWLVLARLDPYRVEWRTPDGRWIRGAPIPFSPTPVDARERKAYLERRSNASGAAPASPPDDSWPATVPPFPSSPLLAMPNGNVLILRTPTADHPGNRHDEIDRQGRLVAWIELPATRRIVGAGPRGGYIVVTDDDGIQHLERHPWP
ncbi:MAG TPA: hypothetical protein VH762_05415 [Gemmatimonadaceae bacterium]|jgi:hypothetical protein